MPSSSSDSDSDSSSASKSSRAKSRKLKSQVSSLSSNLNFKPPIKLDSNNYFFWKSQVLPAIRAFDLESFILGTGVCPPKYVRSARLNSVEKIENDDFINWKKADQLIVCWIFSTLSENVFGHVTHCVTSHEVWKTLESLFAQQSKARVLQLRDEIQNTKKGNLSVSDFVLKMKSLSESLAAAGQPLLEAELISLILGGLGMEYDAVVVNVTGRQGEVNLQEVQYQLMSYESRLAKHNTAVSLDMSNASAQYAFNGNFRGNSNRGGRYRGRGKGRNRGRSGSKFICQLCGKPGHVVSSCYKRFDQAFQGLSMQNMQSPGGQQGNNHGQGFQAHVSQYNTDYNIAGPGNIAGHNTAFHPSQTQMQGYNTNFSNANAFIASPSTVVDLSWYVDSGATNHITSDAQNISQKSNYQGMEKLTVGQEFNEGSAAGGLEKWSLSAGPFHPQ